MRLVFIHAIFLASYTTFGADDFDVSNRKRNFRHMSSPLTTEGTLTDDEGSLFVMKTGEKPKRRRKKDFEIVIDDSEVEAFTDNASEYAQREQPVVIDELPRNGIVKVSMTRKIPVPSEPYAAEQESSGTCTGFVIEIAVPRINLRRGKAQQKFDVEKRIMTNAHCVQYVADNQVALRRPGAEARSFDADIEFVSQQADLALLTVADAAFWDIEDGIISFADHHDFDKEMVIRGYPQGENLLATYGSLNRVTMRDYSMLKEFIGSGHHKLLTLQTQAPVNSGNSGGPAFQLDEEDNLWKCMGVCVEGEAGRKDNIGFLIPIQVIRHFLQDVQKRMLDPAHHMGFPRPGIKFQQTDNAHIRNLYSIPGRQGGMVILAVQEGSTFDDVLEPNDILMEVAGHRINNNGYYQPKQEEDGLTEEIHLDWLFGRKHYGDTISVKMIRDGKTITKSAVLKPVVELVPVLNTAKNGMAIMFKYAIVGPVALVEATQEYFSFMYNCAWTGSRQRPKQISVAENEDPIDAPAGYEGQEQRLVTISAVLNHVVNDDAQGKLVKKVNGVDVYNLQHCLDLVAQAAQAARPIAKVPFRKFKSQQEKDAAKEHGDERAFDNRDFVKIDLAPHFAVYIGPLQNLHELTIDVARENKIPEANIFNGVKYTAFQKQLSADDQNSDSEDSDFRVGQ